MENLINELKQDFARKAETVLNNTGTNESNSIFELTKEQIENLKLAKYLPGNVYEFSCLRQTSTNVLTKEEAMNNLQKFLQENQEFTNILIEIKQRFEALDPDITRIFNEWRIKSKRLVSEKKNFYMKLRQNQASSDEIYAILIGCLPELIKIYRTLNDNTANKEQKNEKH